MSADTGAVCVCIWGSCRQRRGATSPSEYDRCRDGAGSTSLRPDHPGGRGCASVSKIGFALPTLWRSSNSAKGPVVEKSLAQRRGR
jgi:hypothetical protein